MCYPSHPLNERYLFPKPPGASSPHPPPRAHPCAGGMVWERMNPCPRMGGWCLASRRRVGRIQRQTNHRRVERLREIELHRIRWVGRLRRIRLHRIHWWQAGVRVRLSIGRISRRIKRWTNLVQSDIIKQLVRMEEWAHNMCMKLTAMKDVDSHRCSCSHHRGIQHWIKVPILDRKLNINHHVARWWHPLKTTWKHGNEKYKISQ